MDILPNEILSTIINMLSFEDVKKLNRCSKRMYSSCLPIIWNKPRLPKECHGLYSLQQLSHLPIREIHTVDLSYSIDLSAEVISNELLPHLRLVYIDHYACKKTFDVKMMEEIKVSAILHTRAFKAMTEDDFNILLKCVESSNLIKELIIDHDCVEFRNERPKQWDIDWLRKIAGFVKITEIRTYCFKITKENVQRFIQLVATLKQCRLVLHNRQFQSPDSKKTFYVNVYDFTVEDLKALVKKDVKIVEISTNALRNLKENFKEMKRTLKKMIYLEKVNFDLDCPKLITPEMLKPLQALFRKKRKGVKITNTIQEKMYTSWKGGRYLTLD
uniref:F-box domain-containing protein n=1 Tax=Clytia hemisphaerica TaxID=252671 RepID=A0A7M5U0L4_9CNID